MPIMRWSALGLTRVSADSGNPGLFDHTKVGGYNRLTTVKGSGMSAVRVADPSDLRSEDRYVPAEYQTEELEAMKDRRRWQKFVASIPRVHKAPRPLSGRLAAQIRNQSTSDAIVDTFVHTSERNRAVDEPKRTPKRSLYDRHGLTSRGKKVTREYVDRILANRDDRER